MRRFRPVLFAAAFVAAPAQAHDPTLCTQEMRTWGEAGVAANVGRARYKAIFSRVESETRTEELAWDMLQQLLDAVFENQELEQAAAEATIAYLICLRGE